MIARFEDDLSLQSLAIHERPVRTSQVAQPDRKIVDGEHAMVPTHQIAIGAEVAILFAADQELPDVERNRFPLLAALENFQLHLKHGNGTPTKDVDQFRVENVSAIVSSKRWETHRSAHWQTSRGCLNAAWILARDAQNEKRALKINN